MLPFRSERVESDVLLRAVGICMIVYNHVVLYNYGDHLHALFGVSTIGGMGMLLVLSGFSFARFGLHNRDRKGAKSAVVSMVRSIILPCYIAIIGFSIVAGQFNPAEFLMIGNLFRGNWQAGFNTWYPEFLLQVFIGIFALYSIPSTGNQLVRRPALGAALLLAAAIVVHQALARSPLEVAQGDKLPWMLAWNFILGWAIFAITNRDSGVPFRKLVASAVSFFAVLSILDLADTRTWTTLAAGLFLIWIPSIRLPKPLSRAAMILSQATLTLFILHMSAIKVFGILFGRPYGGHAIEFLYVSLAISGLWLICASMWRAIGYFRLQQRQLQAEAGAVRGSTPVASSGHYLPTR